MSRDINRRFIYLYIPFVAILTGLIEGALFYGVSDSLAVGLAAFAGFTIFVMLMSIISIFIGRYFHRRSIDKHNKAKAGNYDLRQEKTIELELPYQDAFRLAQEAIHAITGSQNRVLGMNYTIEAKVHEANLLEGTIKAGTRRFGRWGILTRSFWDDICLNLRVEQINPESSRITIETKPSNPVLIADYGYSLNNLNIIMHYLRQATAEDNAMQRLADMDKTPTIERLDRSQIYVVDLPAKEKQETDQGETS